MRPQTYTRPLLQTLLARLQEPRSFIQTLIGPRQVGKTTLAAQLVERLGVPTHSASADEPGLKGAGWIAAQWEIARLKCRSEEGETRPALLLLDEVQKISEWSESVKRLWDEDSASGCPLRVLLLGSSPLLLQSGLTESLAGRFEVVRATHWSFSEMEEAFGWDLEQYVYFGGYPGAATLIDDEPRWQRYLLDALIETTISRDVLLTKRVDKPALLRRLFELACRYSGRELSYNKIVGQLQDAGNTTTLAGYLDLLSGVGMVTGLQKYAGEAVRRRGSSPKFQVYNTGLMSALSGYTYEEAKGDRAWWGRMVESAVGAHLLALMPGRENRLTYWRDRDKEIDFVYEKNGRPTAIEVKSGPVRPDRTSGLEAFLSRFNGSRPLLIGEGGLPLEEMLRWKVLEG